MAFGKDGELRVIVEVPRGSSVKLNYKPKLRSFVVSRALPLGLTYPFDWGFIPGTKGDDGDPLDAIALHETATYPGVILPCKPIGMVEISEKIRQEVGIEPVDAADLDITDDEPVEIES